MPPKKRRKKEYSSEEWKTQRGRRYRKKAHEAEVKEGAKNGVRDDRDKGAGYSEIVRGNQLFEKYYQGLGFIRSDEWDTFMATLKEDLPATFRITGTRSLAVHVLSCLQKKFFGDLAGLEVEGEKIPPPSPLPWYPGNLAWSVPLSKKFIRKSPLVSKFHAFLVRENSQGNISRQEAVSMIPPLLLDVKPTHKVLDMCAAPGSKTAQLIEFLHADDTVTPPISVGAVSADTEKAPPIPGGVVIANDANNKRCYMLVHQAKRLNSPCLMVTNHDASVFPMLYYHDGDDVRHPLFYDRVLCDVPCSGDATMRKNPSIWRSWNPLLGPSLHKLQLRILNRGLELLIPGGRLVYSTCSLNPLENEAVIAAALNLCKGTVEIVSSPLEGLVSMAGLSSWKAMSKEGEWLDGYSSVPQSLSRHFSSTMFPPDNASTLNLDKCVRVLPHFQDSGGFFIAVLEKKDWLPWQSKMKYKSAVALNTATSEVMSCSQQTQPSSAHAMPMATASQGGNGRTSDLKPDSNNTHNATDSVAAVVSSTEDSVASVVSNTEATAESVAGAVSSTEDTVNVAERPPAVAGDTEDKEAMVKVAVAAVVSSTEDTKVVTPDVQVPPNLQEPAAIAEDQVNSGEIVKGYVTTSKPECKEDEEEERPSAKILGRPDFQSSKKRGFKEDPYVFFAKDTDFFDVMKSYYGFPEGFPLEQLLTRTRTGKKKNLYLSSKLVKELTIRNEHVLKIINIGVKVLSRYDHPNSPCSFRLCQEGVDSLIPYISKHLVMATQADLTILLKEANPLITSLSPYAQEGLQALGIGPVVFVYIPDECSGTVSSKDTSMAPDGPNDSSAISIMCPIYLSGWLAPKSARLYLDKNYRYHFLSIMGHDPPTNQCLNTVRGRGGRGNKMEGDGCDNGCDNEAGDGRGNEMEGEGCGNEGEGDGCDNEEGGDRCGNGEGDRRDNEEGGDGHGNEMEGEGCGNEDMEGEEVMEGGHEVEGVVPMGDDGVGVVTTDM